jgi:hypothetical protein
MKNLPVHKFEEYYSTEVKASVGQKNNNFLKNLGYTTNCSQQKGDTMPDPQLGLTHIT